jgi:hypothetical protein
MALFHIKPNDLLIVGYHSRFLDRGAAGIDKDTGIARGRSSNVCKKLFANLIRTDHSAQLSLST